MHFWKKLISIGTVLASGCASAPKSIEAPIASVLPGTWGFSETEECSRDPQTISFSPDGKKMYVAYRLAGEAGSGDIRKTFTYRVGAQTGNLLRLNLDGETRASPTGDPVSWDLVLLNRDSFCWHRNDWREDECTKAVLRCII
ncbi:MULTISPECIES: hypothetical protein [unclassified Microbulbifer]|uniref:hypothetical protein n=1 Tax=unclassified Microbulbifer TaxID=2619833 RepID=UPI0027E51B15|nr:MULTISPECIES: hypothetical protein [unclassified Microbulbifer]